jgi:hypothetical protein
MPMVQTASNPAGCLHPWATVVTGTIRATCRLGKVCGARSGTMLAGLRDPDTILLVRSHQLSLASARAAVSGGTPSPAKTPFSLEQLAAIVKRISAVAHNQGILAPTWGTDLDLVRSEFSGMAYGTCDPSGWSHRLDFYMVDDSICSLPIHGGVCRLSVHHGTRDSGDLALGLGIGRSAAVNAERTSSGGRSDLNQP